MRRDRSTLVVSLAVLLLSPACGLAQPLVPDADGDGHPLFGATARRPDPARLDYVDERLMAASVSVTFGDLDGDGNADAAVAVSSAQAGPEDSFQPNFVSVLLGSGDGVFAPPTVHLLEDDRELTDVGLADFDADGDLDMAVTDAQNDQILVALNNGDATFAEEVAYPAGDEPRSLHAADLNADGHPDVVALNLRSHDVSVFLNRGDGTLEAERRVFVGGVTQRGIGNLTFPVPGPFFDIADLDADGDPDLAIPARGRVKLLFNDGDGAFTLADEHPVALNPDAYDVELGDLDGDGDADLAVTSTSFGFDPTQAVSVMLNRGDGTFGPAAGYSGDYYDCPSCFYNFTALAMGDIDADGDRDLLLGQENGPKCRILRNLGDGTFEVAETPSTFNGPWFITLEDVNADGRPDMAYLVNRSNSQAGMRVRLNDEEGSFHAPSLQPPPPTDLDERGCCWMAVTLAVDDLDLDEHQDVVVARGSEYDEEVVVLRGDGQANLSVARVIDLAGPEVGSASDVDVGDMNGDGLPDLVVTDRVNRPESSPGLLWVILGEGDMRFAEPVPYDLRGQLGTSVLADLDGDGALDVATWSIEPMLGLDPKELWIRTFMNRGDGTLEFGEQRTLVELPRFMRGFIDAADLDGDGDQDLAATVGEPEANPGSLFVLTNDGTGSFEVREVPLHLWQPEGLVLDDIDRDGDVDAVVVYDHGSGSHEIRLPMLLQPHLTILTNDGTGELTIFRQFVDPSVGDGFTVAVADLFGDGGRDLIFTPANHLAVMRHLGGTSYGPRVGYEALGWIPIPAVGDFNEDGRPDIVTISLNGTDVPEILLNVARRACPADVDGDGAVDADDFEAYLQRFAAGDPLADLTGPGGDAIPDGALTADDFFLYLARFAQGCP